ncbi:hypothetical protein PC128_g1499 [Phytophthora cactorum]|uniref:MULE transposase domain-containing protein n=1 Tax=Phytophthora cactorum TaxID=29920 RepID=A0A8T1DBA1_9STRA|nr:hypothetical protein PC115_g4383 [Phytophthora cactorum]KAG2950285.1 hypothetical protein PC117_g4551 [Phytophthora cactorum]KAG3015086.1 hypothetical protein PC120_g12359 [Phytophthora cactorum]KAG3205295.1 hypothetical protein PC128_g1499 [Phytophthora cactorum]KAG4063122.1 hypothetical protein PC123_g2063 [Phytophthora cactorum]
MTQTFTFGWEMDNAGKPIVGNGADEKPFIVGLSTKALMLRLMVPPESFIMHLDGMYKMNQCEYPVLVVGVSDRSRRFRWWLCSLSLKRSNTFFRSLYYLYVHYTLDDPETFDCEVRIGRRGQSAVHGLAAVFGDNPASRF